MSGKGRRNTLRMCTIIRQSYLHDRRNLVLDFSRTKSIQATGMICVVAEIDRAMRMGDNAQRVSCRLPSGDTSEAMIVRQVLDQIGLLERIGQTPTNLRGDVEHHQTVRHWRYATGTRVDAKPGDVLEQHEGRIAPALMQSMQIGLGEALINSLHHAYRQHRDDGCDFFKERRWWMFTREMDGELEVIVCDLGIGIPRSLPLSWDRKFLARLREFFSEDSPDIAAIKTALVLGQSSTGEEHRGRGLPQVWNATLSSPTGTVGIYSGSAYFGTDVEDGNVALSFRSVLLGTVIAWRVSIETLGAIDG